MRVWNKQLKDITGKDLFKLWFLFHVYKEIDRGFTRSKTGQNIQYWVEEKREGQTTDE